MLVRKIVHALSNGSADGPAVAFPPSARRLVDLGCGTGAAGAAWAASAPVTPAVLGIDHHPWAVEMAAETYRAFGLDARTRRVSVVRAPLPNEPASIIAAFVLNELEASARDELMDRLLRRVERRRRGDRLLIVEPIAASATPWWRTWREAVERAGGRADEWRFRVELPAFVAKLDRAAGLNHRELTGRSLWLS
jgi:hypothetical protein